MPDPIKGMQGAKTQFKRGHEKAGGKQKGTKNIATIMRATAQRLLADPKYRANFKKRLVEGKMHPSVEVMLYYYGYGKPLDENPVPAIPVRIIHEYDE